MVVQPLLAESDPDCLRVLRQRFCEPDTFDTVISLGAHCGAATYQEKFFGNKTTSCFDWLVTPIDSVIKVLEDNGASFGLEFSASRSGAAAICQKYGLIYMHEFPCESDSRIRFSAAIIENVRSKLLYKYDRMIATAAAGRPLFVRYNIAADASDRHAVNPLATATLTRLDELICARIGHSNFHVVIARCVGPHAHARIESEADLPPRFSVVPVTFAPGTLGIEAEWDLLWERFGFVRGQRLAGFGQNNP